MASTGYDRHFGFGIGGFGGNASAAYFGFGIGGFGGNASASASSSGIIDVKQ